MDCKLKDTCERVTSAYNTGNQCTDDVAKKLTRIRDVIVKMNEDTRRNDIGLRTFAICSAEEARILYDELSRMHSEHIQAQKDLARLIFTERQGNCPPCPLLQLDLSIPEAQ